MRFNPDYELDDPAWIREFVRKRAWGTIFSSTAEGPRASHYPLLLEETGDPDRLTLLTHVGRPDEEILGLVSTPQPQVLVVVYGPDGYISPSWYSPGQVIPTWNFQAVHLWGTVEILDPETNFTVLRRLVDEFEAPVDRPRSLEMDLEHTRKVAKGTVGLRIRVHQVRAKNKLSQDKSPEVVENIIHQLESDGPYSNPRLAKAMRTEYGIEVDADRGPGAR